MVIISSEVINLTKGRDGDNDDDDVSVLCAANPVKRRRPGSTSKNPIPVESYFELSNSMMPSSRKTKRVIDLSQDYSYAAYDDDIRVIDIDSFPPLKRKSFPGQSSSCPTADLVEDKDVELTIFMCGICVDEKPTNKLFSIKGCSHFYCFDCMTKYVVSKLHYNITNITCPVSGCEGRLDVEGCRSILPTQVFDRWGVALCEAAILDSEKFYCPYQTCSTILIYDGKEPPCLDTETKCPYCKKKFCAYCRAPSHAKISCEEFQMLNKDEREKEDMMLVKLAKRRKWKRCPRCKFYVARRGGCDHMACR